MEWRLDARQLDYKFEIDANSHSCKNEIAPYFDWQTCRTFESASNILSVENFSSAKLGVNKVCQLSDRFWLRELSKIIGNGAGQEDLRAGAYIGFVGNSIRVVGGRLFKNPICQVKRGRYLFHRKKGQWLFHQKKGVATFYRKGRGSWVLSAKKGGRGIFSREKSGHRVVYTG